jgi:hypothetical protein
MPDRAKPQADVRRRPRHAHARTLAVRGGSVTTHAVALAARGGSVTTHAMALAAVGAALAGCGGPSSAPVGSRVGPALVAALAAADQEREPWRCAAPDGPGVADETLTVGERRWQLAGRAMKLEGDGAVTIGVVADAAGSAPETLAALGRLRAAFDRADLVLSLGGMGATRSELEAAFAALSDRAEWPLIALPGDLEPVPAQIEAIAAARQRGAVVIDGRLLQRIELPGATIALVPGAGAASRLVAGVDGCGYRAADVAAAFADLTPRQGLRILASAEAPRGAVAGEATGDLTLTVGAGQQIDIALHGAAGEATPACSGNRDGSAADLTPGSSDAMPRLPGPRRASTAGILALRGNAWSWKPIADVN